MDSVDSYSGYARWNSGYTDTYPDSKYAKYAKYARSPWYTWHAGWNPRCAGFAGCTQQSRPQGQVVLV